MPVQLNTTKGTCIMGSLALVCFGVGLLVGHLVTPSEEEQVIQNLPLVATQRLEGSKPKSTMDDMLNKKPMYKSPMIDKWEEEKAINAQLLERIDPQTLKENLRYLSERPHMAGSLRDIELANHIRDSFELAGLDTAELIPYDILLSKPDPSNPNKFHLIEDGVAIFSSSHKEIPIHIDDEDPEFVDAFSAYTPAATVSTEPGVGVVYVNYGRIEDFKQLEELGVNITGHIALVRYGKIFRGNKVRHAEQAGVIGILIFSDPADVALDGIEPKDVYDNSFWLPGTGMQRGYTYLGEGDPLTPGWPSTKQAYRIAIEDADLHNIPSQPIGYADAAVLLERLDGEDAPSDWQGGLPNMTYKLGPLFTSEYQNISVTLSTHNQLAIEENFNVIGMIKGSVEPDRYVMLGNHRDAWGYGVSDPSSGTAQLLEVARVYGTLLKEGYRPRRTIVFCSWGAEEFGLIGSREWVEEHLNKIQARTVAYINTDTCTSGPKLYINASPMLWNVFHNITALVPGIENPERSMFDEWKEYFEALKPDAPEKPVMETLGAGSDFSPFNAFAGVPAADIRMNIDEVKYNITTYPFYHTGYETFYMFTTFVDPEFKITQGCGRISSLALKYLADSSIIPYSINRFPELMMKSLKDNKYREMLMSIYDKYGELEKAVERFQEATEMFQLQLMAHDISNEMQTRQINDQLMKIEQSFIIPEGLPGRPGIRHAIFAPSKFDNYAASSFPGLSDLLHNYELLSEEEKLDKNKEIKKHISDLTIMTDRATSLLKESHLI